MVLCVEVWWLLPLMLVNSTILYSTADSLRSHSSVKFHSMYIPGTLKYLLNTDFPVMAPLLYCRSRPTFRAFTDLRLWVWSVFRFYSFLTARLPILRNPVGSLAGSFLPSVPLPPRPNEKTYAHLCSTPRFLELFSNPFFHLSHLKVFPKPAFYIFGVA